MRTLIALRWQRLRRRMTRRAGNLRPYFDFWSIVHYIFALAAFGPGLYQYWADPPALPAIGLWLLGLWPVAGLVFGWGWAVSQGIFGAAAGVPLPITRADVHLLLTAPIDRRSVLLERFVSAWWKRAYGPVALVLLFALLTLGYHAVAWTQVLWLALTLLWLALGVVGLSTAIFTLGPQVRRWLSAFRYGGQVLMLAVSVVGFLVSGAQRSVPLAGAPAMPAALHLNLLPAVGPALLFAALATGLAWLLTGRRDLALWAGASPDDDPLRRQGRAKKAPTRGYAHGIGAFRWKQRAALRKRPVWQWLSYGLLPVAGALLIGPFGSRVGGAITPVMAALALFQGARFLTEPAGEELRNLSRLGRLPATTWEFLGGVVLEVSLWLLLPCLLLWWTWGAGWLTLPGGPLTAFVLAVLALQNNWAAGIAKMTVGSLAPSDSLFAYIALAGSVLLGQWLLTHADPAEALLFIFLGLAGGAVAILARLYWDILSWRLS